ncbi:MAG: PucR family transcriptional regulator ligand-binding domain-containing protein, partial [Janthinobacterium lividum]
MSARPQWQSCTLNPGQECETAGVVSVEDLLRTPELGLRLLTGDPGATLRWVATSELDDPAPFLEGGELLLTTGLRARDDWDEWVARLATAGVPAVGLGVGLSHDIVPRSLIAAGTRHGVAVLEVPGPTPFIAVSRRVADLLRRSENEAESAAARTQRDLAADAVGPQGRQRVLHRLARALHGAAWLLSSEGEVVESSPLGASLPPETRAALARVRPQGLRAALTDVSPTRTLLLRAVGTSEVGWLLVRAAPGLPRAVLGTVGTAAALLTLLAPRGVDVPGELAGLALDLLCTGDPGTARRVLSAMGAPTPPDRVRVLWGEGTGTPPLAGTLAARTVRSAGRLVVVCADDGLASVLRVLREREFRVGVGRAADLVDAGDGDASAAAALARTTPTRPVVHADDTTHLGLLATVDGLAASATELLAPLDALPDAES